MKPFMEAEQLWSVNLYLQEARRELATLRAKVVEAERDFQAAQLRQLALPSKSPKVQMLPDKRNHSALVSQRCELNKRPSKRSN